MRKKKGTGGLSAVLAGTLLVALGAVVAGGRGSPGGGPPGSGPAPTGGQRGAQTGYKALLDSTIRPVNPAATVALTRLRKVSGLSWRVGWSEQTGCAKGLEAIDPRGGTSGIRVAGATFEVQARNFINQNLDLFWPPDPSKQRPALELRLKSAEARWRARVVFGQYSQGVEVYRSEVKVGFDPNGLLRSVSSTLRSVTSVNISPTLSSTQAEEATMASKYATPRMRPESGTHLVLFPSSPPRLMYLVNLWLGPELLVDAHTGEIVYVWSRDIVDFHTPPTDTANRTRPEKLRLDSVDVPKNPPKGTGRSDSGAFRFVGDSGVIFTGSMQDSLDFRNSSVGLAMQRDSPEEFRKIDSIVRARFRERRTRHPTPLPPLPPGTTLLPIIKRVYDRSPQGLPPMMDTKGSQEATTTYTVDSARISSPMDYDGDGYARQVFVEFHVTKSPGTPSAVVYAEVRGRDAQHVQRFLAQTGQFPVGAGFSGTEIMVVDSLPHGVYDFRIDIYLYDGTWLTRANYGAFPGITGVKLETGSEDAIFLLDAFAADGVNDYDGDGFFSTIFLEWDVDVNEGTHHVFSELAFRPMAGRMNTS